MLTAALILLASAYTRPMERVSTMDPAMSQSLYDSRAIRLAFETPLDIDYLARPYRLVPGFCELPEISPDGRRYVFRVRNATSSPLDANDVVRGLLRLRDPSVVSPNGWIVKDVETARAVDAKTVEIVLVRPVHYFPWLMAMTPTAVRGRDGGGSGTYKLAYWRKNHEMTFSRRVPDPDGRHFDVVRYLVVDDLSTQWLMFLKGELDFIGEISRDNWDSVIGPDGRLDPEFAKRGVTLHAIPGLDSMFVGVNMRDPALGKNRALRQALNAAFDAPEWLRFYHHSILEADGPVPPGVDGRLETPFQYSFDLAKARRLMVEAGYPDGVDPRTGRRLVLTLTQGRATQESREAGELMAAFYERIGIRLELAFMTWDAFLKAVNEGRTQLFRMGWVGDYPDAQNFLQLFHSSCVSPGPNHTCYSNVEFDAAYDAALASKTAEERNRHWRRCQEIVREDCPWVFTHFTKSHSLVRRRVGNFVPSCFPYGQERFYTCEENEK